MTGFRIVCRSAHGALIEYMGGSTLIPNDVADAIEARRVDRDLYRIKIIPAGRYQTVPFGVIEWVGSQTHISTEAAECLLEYLSILPATPPGLDAEIAAVLK